MKATGIVRRIDNLGRIVIPKEIRKTLRIKEGDALEIYTDREGEVILKKYSPIEELGESARQYADALHQILGRSIFVTDTEQIIAASGLGKKEAMNQQLAIEYEKIIQDRQQKILSIEEKGFMDIYSGSTMEVEAVLITPIISEGNVIGSIVIIQKHEKEVIGEVEKKLAQVGACYLGSQME